MDFAYKDGTTSALARAGLLFSLFFHSKGQRTFAVTSFCNHMTATIFQDTS